MRPALAMEFMNCAEPAIVDTRLNQWRKSVEDERRRWKRLRRRMAGSTTTKRHSTPMPTCSTTTTAHSRISCKAIAVIPMKTPTMTIQWTTLMDDPDGQQGKRDLSNHDIPTASSTFQADERANLVNDPQYALHRGPHMKVIVLRVADSFAPTIGCLAAVFETIQPKTPI
jgi:hypothetical protein